eukprot:scaffold20950_cov151-Isochrysis_galbana.AAC.3
MRPAGAGGRRPGCRVPGAHRAGEILTPASSRFAPAVYVLRNDIHRPVEGATLRAEHGALVQHSDVSMVRKLKQSTLVG